MASALIPIGAVAFVAGCAGGGVNSSGAYVPPTSGGGTVGTTKARISISFAVQGASAARSAQALRQPQAVPTDAAAIGVRFIAQDGTVETEQMFAVPSPVPTSTTLTVNAPIGNDQIALAVYEPWPTNECSPPSSGPVALVRKPSSHVQSRTLSAAQQKRLSAIAAARGAITPASLAARQAQAFRHAQADPSPPPNTYPVNGYFGAVPISANGTNAISAQVSPIAFGADLYVDNGPSQLVTYPTCFTQWMPLENLAQTQTAVMEVDPYDICYQYFYNLGTAPANPVAVTGPSGVVLPSPIPVPGATSGTPGYAQFNVTYAANQSGSGTAQNGIIATPYYPLDAAFAAQAASTLTVDVTPDYFIFALDNSQSNLSIYDALTGNVIGEQQEVGRGAPSVARNPQQGARSTNTIQSHLASAWRSPAGSRSAQGFTYGGSSGVNSAVYNGYPPITAMDAVNVSACPGGYAAAVAVVGLTADNAGIDVFTVSQDSSGNRTMSGPLPVAWAAGGVPTAVAFDSACRLYVGDSSGYLGVGSISGMTSVQPITPSVTSGTPAPITAIVANGSTMYASYNDFNTYTAEVSTFSAGSAGPVSSPVFSVGSPMWTDALSLAGGQVWLAYENATPGAASAYVAQVPGSPSNSTSLPAGYLYGFAGTIGGATLYEASDAYPNPAGYLFSIAGGTVTNLANANGLYANGVAVSLDSPTSTLWLSSSNGYLQGYSIPSLTQPYWLSYPIYPSTSEGPLSIAP